MFSYLPACLPLFEKLIQRKGVAEAGGRDDAGCMNYSLSCSCIILCANVSQIQMQICAHARLQIYTWHHLLFLGMSSQAESGLRVTQ